VSSSGNGDWRKPIRRKTGLIVADAYFSATKLKWILDNVPGAEGTGLPGAICFRTVDSWLVWNLTGGLHVTDCSNASRTMLYNIHEMRWDPEILDWLDIPAAMLPEVRECSGDFGALRPDILGRAIPILGVAGDQQAALFGQACFAPGMTKNTYGTGCFVLMNTGGRAVSSGNRLLTTIAWKVDGRVQYALEGSIFMGGATVQWLRDELGLIRTAADSEEAASRVPDTGGAYLVPAFAGLGAPWWDMYARGTLVGMTRGTGRAHIFRAARESIAYQTRAVGAARAGDAGMEITVLRADGGASANNLLMQFQADILGIPVERPSCIETTALGAACLAGLAAGVWPDQRFLAAHWSMDRFFRPSMDEALRERAYAGWLRAVARSRGWASES
jgi:glycerol kinase